MAIKLEMSEFNILEALVNKVPDVDAEGVPLVDTAKGNDSRFTEFHNVPGVQPVEPTNGFSVEDSTPPITPPQDIQTQLPSSRRGVA